MKWTKVVLLFLFAVSYYVEGYTQRTSSSGDPPQFVNRFFARCFARASRSRRDWRGIIDFIILHTSWFQNSDVGECAANNPNVTEEANCWKAAFKDLVSPGSRASAITNICVDRFVTITAAYRSKRNTPSLVSSVRERSLDSSECPLVDREEFATQVVDAIKSSASPSDLSRLVPVLKGFKSITEFVEQVILCTEPTCDLCNINYKSTEDPKRELKCNECWPTRLAGMIKNSSLLKEVTTRVAVSLGNNRPAMLPQAPMVNQFFASCLSSITTNQVNWGSITDFLIFHTTWFENSNIGSCAPNNPDVIDEANCWKTAFKSVISKRTPLSAVIDICVDRFVTRTRSNARNISKRDVKPLHLYTTSTNETNIRQTSEASLDNQDCPAVDPGLFNSLLLQAVSAATSPNDFRAYDRTLDDFLSVIQFVTKQAICTEPTCDECNLQYSNPLVPSQKLRCNECWPSRLAGMIKSSSPLKNASTTVAMAVENSGSLPTKLICGSNSVDISLGRDDFLNLRLSSHEEVVVWGSRIHSIDDVDQSCRPSRNKFSFSSSSCQPFIETKDDMVHFTYTVRKVLAPSFLLTTDTYIDSTMNVTCSYKMNQDITANSNLFPVVRRISLPERRNVGDFNIDLGFYDNRFVTRLPRNSTSFISTEVFLSGHTDVTVEGVTLQALHCWASRSRTDRSGGRLILVRNGCPTFRAVKGLRNPILENGISTTVRFKFRRGIFKRFGKAPIYTHCLMRVCNTKEEDCEFHCNNPSGRKRREIESKVYNEGSLISSGTLHEMNKLQSCEMDNVKCTDHCSVLGGEIVCSCFPGRTLYSDGKTCLDNAFLEEHRAKLCWSPLYILSLSLLGVMFLALLFALVVRNKIKK